MCRSIAVRVVLCLGLRKRCLESDLRLASVVDFTPATLVDRAGDVARETGTAAAAARLLTSLELG